MAAGDEDAALMAEIARLTGQINQHNSSAGPAYPHGGYGFQTRGGRGRGRGRGRGNATQLPSRHRTLVLNSNQKGAEAEANGSSTQQQTQDQQQQPSWVRRKTTHNMSLVSSDAFEKTEPSRLAAMQATQEAKAKAKSDRASKGKAPKPSKPSSSSASVRRGDNMGEVIIDGVVFAFDETGTKLVKKASRPADDEEEAQATADSAPGMSASTSATTPPSPSKAPLRTSINGQSFVRTKRGNLISAQLVEERRTQKENAIRMKKLARMGRQIGENEKTRSANRNVASDSKASGRTGGPKGLCSYFTKTGQCKRGLSCPFEHDSNKVAICPASLRPSSKGGCNQPPGLCPLSHNPLPQRTPHCLHYLRSQGQSCRNGEQCLFVHPLPSSGVRADSPICMDFARLGWCDKGKACEQRHTFDCPDFVEKGKCDRKGCRLQHVIRAAPAEAAADTTVGGAGDNEESADAGLTQVTEEQGQALISSGKRTKRKRAFEVGDGIGDEAGGETILPGGGGGSDGNAAGANGEGASGGLSFVPRGGKKQKGKAAAPFTQEKDYIGFDDDDDDGEDGDDDEEEDSDEDSDQESVSSDDEDSEGSDSDSEGSEDGSDEEEDK